MKNNKQKYVIGSGWFTESPDGYEGFNFKAKGIRGGCNFSRSLKFHLYWKELVFKYTNPRKTIIVDSNSPVPIPDDPRIELIKVDENYNAIHEDNKFRYDGFIRGVMIGANYAFCCNSDFLYVEQDLFVLGKGWVERIYEHSDGTKILVLNPQYQNSRVPWPVQVSLIFIPHFLIPEFVYKICKTRSKNLIAEEMFTDNGLPFDFLPFGAGRCRPINWNDRHVCLQHMSEEEIKYVVKRENLCKLDYGTLRVCL